MQLSEWLNTQEYGAGARLCRDLKETTGQKISRQLLQAYIIGKATPGADVIEVVRYLTQNKVRKVDWLALAKKVGRVNVTSTGRPLRPRPKKTKRRSKR